MGLFIGVRLKAQFQSLSKKPLFHYIPCLNSFHDGVTCDGLRTPAKDRRTAGAVIISFGALISG